MRPSDPRDARELLLKVAALVGLITVGALCVQLCSYASINDYQSGEPQRSVETIVRMMTGTAIVGGAFVAFFGLCALAASARSRRPSTAIRGDAEFDAACIAATQRVADPRPSAGEVIAIIDANSPYTILGVTDDANAARIKAAYRRLMKQHHPDRGGDPELAKRIIAAYRALGGRVRARIDGAAPDES